MALFRPPIINHLSNVKGWCQATDTHKEMVMLVNHTEHALGPTKKHTKSHTWLITPVAATVTEMFNKAEEENRCLMHSLEADHYRAGFKKFWATRQVQVHTCSVHTPFNSPHQCQHEPFTVVTDFGPIIGPWCECHWPHRCSCGAIGVHCEPYSVLDTDQDVWTCLEHTEKN